MPSASLDTHRRRRHRARAVAPPAVARPTARSEGYVSVQLPPGSRKLPPVQAGDQGISKAERPHAEAAIKRLFEAPGIDMVATYDPDSGTYELRSRTGMVRWERWVTPAGELRYVVVAQAGDDPIPSVDGTILTTLEEEAAAAGGIARPVPKDRNSYPDMFARLSQVFDHRRSPDFVFIPTTGGDPNFPGSHGIPDIVQSRAPLVIAGPGIAKGAVSNLLVRHEDIAPTVADLVGVQPVVGTNASGVRRTQLLKWQDGVSFAPSVAQAREGVSVHGIAQRALMFVVDGMSQTLLWDELKRGTLPNIARIFAAGTTFRNGTLANYPTVTWANQNTLQTGAAPGHNGMVNNSWWNRDTRDEQLISDGGFQNIFRNGKLVDPQVETLYEAVNRSFPNALTMAVNQPSGRGADVSILDIVGIQKLLPNIFGIASKFLRNKGQDTKIDDHDWKGTAPLDNVAAAIAETKWSGKDVPKYGVVGLALVDKMSHHYGPTSEQARAALRQADAHIGRVLDALERRGIADSTAVILTADHGMASQAADDGVKGGWKDALERAAADGARVKESTRFVYVQSMRWQLEGSVPAAGASGTLAVRVVNDDEGTDGMRPPIAGATVTVRDAAGHTWTAVTDANGRVQLPIQPTAGPLEIVVEQDEFSRETGSIPLAPH